MASIVSRDGRLAVTLKTHLPKISYDINIYFIHQCKHNIANPKSVTDEKEEAMARELTVVELTALAQVKGPVRLQSPTRRATLTEQVSESFIVLWQGGDAED